MTSTENKDYYEFTENSSEFKWILHNFASYSDTPGAKVTSPTFSSRITGYIDETRWVVDLYPNGWNNKFKENISLCLRPLNNFGITAYCNVTIFSSVRVYDTCKIGPFVFVNQIGKGKAKLIERNSLLTDLKRGNGILTIVVKIGFADTSQQANPRDNLLKDLGSLLETEENSDVILISSDGSEHKVHKTILMCRSKVFLAMFHHNMKESQNNIVKIEDIDNETLKAMLQFLYTGEFKCVQERTKNLLIAADKYELDDLKRMCLDYLHKNLRIDNVLELFEFAHNYDYGKLKIKAKEYFLHNCKETMSYMGPEGIRNLSRNILEELLCNLIENQK